MHIWTMRPVITTVGSVRQVQLNKENERFTLLHKGFKKVLYTWHGTLWSMVRPGPQTTSRCRRRSCCKRSRPSPPPTRSRRLVAHSPPLSHKSTFEFWRALSYCPAVVSHGSHSFGRGGTEGSIRPCLQKSGTPPKEKRYPTPQKAKRPP